MNNIDLYELSDDKDNYYLKTESKLRVLEKDDPTFIEKVELIKVEFKLYFDLIDRFVRFLNKKPAKDIKELFDFQASQSKHKNQDENADVINIYRAHINSIKVNIQFLEDYLKYDTFFFAGSIIECQTVKVIKM